MTRKEMFWSRGLALFSSVFLYRCYYYFIGNGIGDSFIIFLAFFSPFIIIFDSLIKCIKRRDVKRNLLDLAWGIDGIVLILSVATLYVRFDGVSKEVLFYTFAISFTIFFIIPSIALRMKTDLWKRESE